MENGQTSTAKTTPFSINDILTKRDSALFQRRILSGDLAPLGEFMDSCDGPSADMTHDLQLAKQRMDYSENSEQIRRSYSCSQQSDGAREFRKKKDNQSVKNERRGSLDCFLVDKNHNYKAETCLGDSERHRLGSQKYISHRFYDLPLVVGAPLDMRRSNNDSGENKVITFIRWQKKQPWISMEIMNWRKQDKSSHNCARGVAHADSIL